MQDPRNHPMFKNNPLTGRVALSTGEAPTPYHIYDGYGLFIGGRCDFAAAAALLQNETVSPVKTSDGAALMGIWICNFTDASLGAHTELQISFFVSRDNVEPIKHHPLNTLLLVLTRRDVQMLCFGLWNNSPVVVAYNREHLSLNARLAQSSIERDPQGIRFDFTDSATGQQVIAGAVQHPQRATLNASMSLMAALGFQQSLSIQKQPWISMPVLNSRGVVLDRNAAAQTFTKNDLNVVRFFDRSKDVLKIELSQNASLQFTPDCVQYMDGFKLVFLDPQ